VASLLKQRGEKGGEVGAGLGMPREKKRRGAHTLKGDRAAGNGAPPMEAVTSQVHVTLSKGKQGVWLGPTGVGQS
jgi:hypothetical protein